MNRFSIQRNFRKVTSKEMPVLLVFACWIKFQFCKLALLPFSFETVWQTKTTIEPEHLIDSYFVAQTSTEKHRRKIVGSFTTWLNLKI